MTGVGTLLMPDVQFVVASASTHRSERIEVNAESLSWVFEEVEKLFSVPKDDIVGVSASEYVLTVIDKVCGNPPPSGIFYLVSVDGRLQSGRCQDSQGAVRIRSRIRRSTPLAAFGDEVSAQRR